MVEGYSFLAEWVDQNVGKGTVIARRIPGKTPSIPPRLLSDVAKVYNPLDPFQDIGIQKPLELQDCSSSWMPNGILLTGIAETASNDSITKTMLLHLQRKRSPRIFWLKDSQFFVLWEKEKEDELDLNMIVADFKNQNIGDVLCCFVSVTAIGGLINADGEILARAKDRHLGLRIEEENEWMEPKSTVKANWKKYLVDLI